MEQEPLKLWTIGHGIVKRDELLAKIREVVGEDFLLVDVRSFPYSRFNPSTNKKAMVAEIGDVEEDGQYIHMAQLGGYGWVDKPDEDGCVLGRAAAEIIEALDAICDSITEEGAKIVLMCSENDVNNCHRRGTAFWIAARCEQKVEIEHILARPLKPSKKPKRQ